MGAALINTLHGEVRRAAAVPDRAPTFDDAVAFTLYRRASPYWHKITSTEAVLPVSAARSATGTVDGLVKPGVC